MMAFSTNLAIFHAPGLGFFLALLVAIVGLWIVELIAPEAALGLVFALLIGVAVTRPGLAGQLRSLFGA